VGLFFFKSSPHVSCRNGVAGLKPCVEDVELIGERDDGLGITAISPCDGSQSTPHASGVNAMVVRLQFVPVGTFYFSDGPPKIILGLPPGLQVPRAIGRGACV